MILTLLGLVISNKGSSLVLCMRFFLLRRYTVCKSLDWGDYEITDSITIHLLHDIAKIQKIATKEYAAQYRLPMLWCKCAKLFGKITITAYESTPFTHLCHNF